MVAIVVVWCCVVTVWTKVLCPWCPCVDEVISVFNSFRTVTGKFSDMIRTLFAVLVSMSVTLNYKRDVYPFEADLE